MNKKSRLFRARKYIFVMCFVFAGFLMAVNVPNAYAATFVVDDVGDVGDDNAGNGVCDTGGGVCTLRAAIEEANALAGADTIEFAIGGEVNDTVVTINPGANLPALNDATGATTIDGCTQANASANTSAGALDTNILVVLEDPDADVDQLLEITSNGNEVFCLNLRGDDMTGIFINNADNNTIRGNFIGTNEDGDDNADQLDVGVDVTDGDGNIIGGPNAADKNLISNNVSEGILVFDSTNTEIENNFIGPDATGLAADGLNSVGIFLENADGTDILDNLISGNDGQGIKAECDTDCTDGLTVQGNIIGLDRTGNAALANTSHGIQLEGNFDAETVRIENVLIGTNGDGTDDIAERNIISENEGIGIFIDDTDGLIIAGNFIGTDIDGDTAFGNDEQGIALGNVLDVIIGVSDNAGGGEANEGNIIASNGLASASAGGVLVSGFTAPLVIAGNIIGEGVGGEDLGNGSVGISITPDFQKSATNTNMRIGTDNDGNNDDIEGNVVANTVAIEPLIGNEAFFNSEQDGGGIFIAHVDNSVIAGNRVEDNDSSGLILVSTQDNVIGNATNDADTTNRFIENGEAGVVVYSNADYTVISAINGAARQATGNIIRHNSFEENTGIGIDLFDGAPLVEGAAFFSLGAILSVPDGVTANDAGDPDAFANNLQNFPVIDTANIFEVSGTLDTDSAEENGFIEVYEADADDEEGLNFLGEVAPDANGDWALPFGDYEFAIAQGDVLVATFTSENDDTSEFSADFEVQADPPFVVDDTGDAGDDDAGNGVCDTGGGVCTLRAAIEEANAFNGPNSIDFNIAGVGPFLIQPATDLPALNDNTGGVDIDGCSQPGVVANTNAEGPLNTQLQITIDGQDARTNIFDIESDGNVLRCLNLQRSDQAIIQITDSSNNRFYGNFIGTNIDGTVGGLGSANTDNIIIENDSDGNIIGTNGNGANDIAERNLISGSDFGAGIAIEFDVVAPDGNRISSNIIGLGADGETVLANGADGIFVNGGDNTIIGTNGDGTSDNIEGNVISGNDFTGIGASEVDGLTIAGNIIGLSADGDTAVPNAEDGISLEGAVNTIIGKNSDASAGEADERNIISGNGESGIDIISGVFDGDIIISGNLIGTNLANAILGNTEDGIEVSDEDDVHIGFVDTNGEANTIANNGEAGIVVAGTAADVTISQNSITNNAELGIDLGDDLVTENDAGDVDAGPNALANFPVFETIEDIQVLGNVDTVNPQNGFVQIFRNAAADASGNGEGQVFLAQVVPNANGDWQSFAGFNPGDILSATFTDENGNTSEFSDTAVVVEQANVVNNNNRRNGGGGGSSSIDRTTPVVLLDRDVDTVLSIIRPLDLKRISGAMPRPVAIQEFFKRIKIEIDKGTRIENKNGDIFQGMLIVPKILNASNFDTIPENYQFLMGIKIGAKDGTELVFSKPYTFTIPLSIRGEDSTEFIKVFAYNQNTEEFEVLEGSYDTKKRSITVYPNHMSYFVVMNTKGETIEVLEDININNAKTSQINTTTTSSIFSDMNNHWGKKYVETLKKKGIVRGKDNNTFDPDAYITRAELTKIAIESFGIPLVENGNNPFADVDSGAWYADYIITAKENGIVNGFSTDTFKPNETVTRAEALKILLLAGKVALSEGNSDFSDVGSEWFAQYVNHAVKKGVVNGYADGTFRPNAPITRAEASKIVYMLMEL